MEIRASQALSQAVDTDGNVVEVGPEGILGTQQDSSIYTHNGTLTEDRRLDGNNQTLTFTDISTLTDSSTTSLSTTTGNNTVESTGGDVVVEASGTVDVDGATVDIDASGVSTLTSGSTNTVESTGGDVEITATNQSVLVDADSSFVSDDLQLTSYGDSSRALQGPLRIYWQWIATVM